jgi:hypothetical protein
MGHKNDVPLDDIWSSLIKACSRDMHSLEHTRLERYLRSEIAHPDIRLTRDDQLVRIHQWASSQLSPTAASTFSGTVSSAAVAIRAIISDMIALAALASTSKMSSSCTCITMRA